MGSDPNYAARGGPEEKERFFDKSKEKAGAKIVVNVEETKIEKFFIEGYPFT